MQIFTEIAVHKLRFGSNTLNVLINLGIDGDTSYSCGKGAGAEARRAAGRAKRHYTLDLRLMLLCNGLQACSCLLIMQVEVSRKEKLRRQ